MQLNPWSDPSGIVYVAPFGDADEEISWIAAEKELSERSALNGTLEASHV